MVTNSATATFATAKTTFGLPDALSVSAVCPDGKVATGGGASYQQYTVFGAESALHLQESRPTDDLHGWQARVSNNATPLLAENFAGAYRVTVYAICAQPA
jgi:hypothetical protein